MNTARDVNLNELKGLIKAATTATSAVPMKGSMTEMDKANGLKITYTDLQDYVRLTGSINMMDDIKAGVPRGNNNINICIMIMSSFIN